MGQNRARKTRTETMGVFMRTTCSAVATAVIGLFASALTIIAATPASAATDHSASSSPCVAAGAQKIVDVTGTVMNDVDFGVDGHAWAITNHLEHDQIWAIGSGHFCLQVEDTGTFTAFGSTSPNLSGTLSRGVSGTYTASAVMTRTGSLETSLPRSGDVGTWDRACDNGSCAQVCLYAAYFGITNSRHVLDETEVDDAGEHGSWTLRIGHDQVRESTGDVTG